MLSSQNCMLLLFYKIHYLVKKTKNTFQNLVSKKILYVSNNWERPTLKRYFLKSSFKGNVTGLKMSKNILPFDQGGPHKERRRILISFDLI